MGIGTVPVEECGRRMRDHLPVHLLDVRMQGEYARVHATGARLMPLPELDAAAVTAMRTDPEEPVYVLCKSGKRAATACARLEAAGVKQVFSVEGGTEAWEKAGLPVERGVRHVISLERQVRIGAGAIILAGATLTWLVHPGFLLVPAFVGGGLLFAGITDFCGMAKVLLKMPWNN